MTSSTGWLSLCGGFLLAVLWFDLMFDVQALGQPPGPLPEATLASIAAYYHRVTTEADPMGRAVGLVMGITLLGTAWQWWRRSIPRPLAAAALAACGAPIALAVTRILPDAVRLGARTDPPAVQSELARSIATAHGACLVAIVLFCGIQLAAHVRAARSVAAGRASGPASHAGPDRPRTEET